MRKSLSEIFPGFQTNNLGHLFFLAMLAYPSPKETKQRNEFMEAMHVFWLKSLMKNKLIKKDEVLDKYRTYPKRKAIRKTNHGFLKRIINLRMNAAWLALDKISRSHVKNADRLLTLVNNGKLLIYPSDMKLYGPRRSADPIGFEEFHSDDKYSDSEWRAGEESKIYGIIYKPSRPVLHMALALLPLIIDLGIQETSDNEPLRGLIIRSNEVKKRSGMRAIIQNDTSEISLDLITNPDWLNDILFIAECWYDDLPEYLPITKEKLIPIS